MNKRVAAIIVNYNMPERTDALCSYMEVHAKWPHDLIVVDNGSDSKYVSEWTTIKLEQNVQTTNGWLCGVAYARGLAHMRQEPLLAYWFIITSAEFVVESGDPLTPLAQALIEMPDAVGISQALTKDSTTAHGQMKVREFEGLRRVRAIDNIAALWRSNWFDSIGGFDPRLTMAWGIDIETCYLARKQGKSIWVHEDTLIKKDTNVAYRMDRMGMTADERANKAVLEMRRVLGQKYGSDFLTSLYERYSKAEWL